jgi:hypothetical protein
MSGALIKFQAHVRESRHSNGRVGLGVAAGALPPGFEAMGILLAAGPWFKSGLPRIVAILADLDLPARG